MATEFDSGGGSKERRTDEEGELAAEEDRITALPEALQLHILGLLPFKSAVRTGALSTQWRALWTRRWPAPSSLDLRLAPHDSPQPLLDSLERRGRRRLDRFSISFHTGQLNDEDFGRCLDYAAACAVADLDVVHLSNSRSPTSPTPTPQLQVSSPFRLPPGGNPHLARLSVTGTCVDYFRHQEHPYPFLKAIHLHRATVSDATLLNLLAAARPLLRTLDIRYCKDLTWVNLAIAGPNLKNVAVVECESLTDFLITNPSSLRSFRYSGAYLAANLIPASSAIDDLYICFGGPACRPLRHRWVVYNKHNRPAVRGYWLHKLVNLSNLTVLTLCSSALRRVSAKARARSTAGNAASCKLQNLKEVQLLMFAMYNENLDDIMAFLMTCCTPRLERLFVQLPTRRDQYKPEEEPSESEVEASEDLSNGEESEEDQSEQDESEEGSEEYHANEDESDEDGSEEDHSQEDDSDEYHSQGDSEENHSVEDHSEEDHSQEGDLEENHSQEDESEEEGSEEDHSQEDEPEEDHSQEDHSEEYHSLSDSEEYHSEEDDSEEYHSQEGGSEENHSQEDESEKDRPKENGSEEQGFAEGQSKEDGSKRHLSNEGELVDETHNGCENLMLLKMTNFMGHHNEMQLVSFVLKKSACLNQLMLFTPESDHQGRPQQDHLNTSDFLQTQLLALEKASLNAQIILSEPDVDAIKPLHSETFVKV
ncbi:uncharacterized protein LOC124656879 [Lolium rigidum]|uniref:uncharacterized protein LOC124656879 n=1 Tax=Lolium rigidum TaxID=89674 RepID=UPI001F5CD00C|nr:uncharacterized protein LOC124656879 [Lolium rigidum]